MEEVHATLSIQNYFEVWIEKGEVVTLCEIYKHGNPPHDFLNKYTITVEVIK